VDTPEQLSSCVLLQSVVVQIRHKSPYNSPRLGPFGYADLSIRRAVVFYFRG